MKTPIESQQSFLKRFGLPAALAALLVAGGLYWGTSGPSGTSSVVDEATQTAVSPDASEPDVSPEELLKPGPLADNVIGNADAKVTIVEYASTTCPHCADFHKTTLPGLKAKYLDTGKARLVFREYPRDNLDAAVFMLARCQPKEKYFPFVGVMFEQQESWAFGEGNARPKLLEIAKQAGFSEESFDKCIKDEKLLKDLVAQRDRASDVFKVNGTPAIFVNGKRLNANPTVESIEKLMQPFLAP